MKKLLTSSLLSGALVCSLFADAKDDAFLKFFNEILSNGAKVEILEAKQIEGSSLKSYIVEIDYEGHKIKDMFFSDGVVFIGDNDGRVVDMKAKKSIKEDFMVEQMKEKQRQVLPDLADFITKGSDYIVKIGNDKSKPTTVVFSDPECPYCVKKLDTIEEDLKSANIVYVLTPVHGQSAYEKILTILKECKTAKTDKQKIQILKKYYDAKNEKWEKFSEQDLKKAYMDVASIMERFKVRATPTIIENVPVK